MFGLLTYSYTFSQTNLGEKHNQVVNYLNEYDFTDKTEDDFMDDLLYYSASLVDPNVFPEGKFGIWGTIWACGQADPSGLRNPQTYEEVLTLLEADGKISSESNAFLSSIVSGTENISDYNDFTTAIANIESNYGIDNLPEQEKYVVQGLLSVFKESAAYWNNHYDPEEITPEHEGRFNIRCFWCVAKNDLKGAALGFLIGNCICTKFGVPDPIICGAVGAVAFGGLYSWGAKVCPDICRRCRKPNPDSYPSWLCKIPFLYLWN